MPKEIYLDNSATSPVYPEVVQEMALVLREVYGNPSSLHGKGLEAERLIKRARENVAAVLGVRPLDVYFTSGGTEANNLAIRGVAGAYYKTGKHLITTKIEHPSVLKTFQMLEEDGFSVTYLNVNQKGEVDSHQLVQALTDDTILVSIMHVNNEVGSVQPLDEIGEAVQRHGKAILHVDAVQSYGKLPLRPLEQGIHLVTMSAHKIHGPKGVGAIYVQKGIRLKPLFTGGKQEGEIRPGTENVAGIVGFGEAAAKAYLNMEEFRGKISYFKKIFGEEVLKRTSKVRINGPKLDEGAPHILNLSFAEVKGEVLVHALEAKGIYVSTGSACSSRHAAASHVLIALGLKPEEIEGGIRVSFSLMNTEDDVREAARQIAETVEELRMVTRR